MVGVIRPGGSFGRAEQIATLGFGNAFRSLSSDGFLFGNPLANCPEAVLQRKFLESTYFLLHGYPIASTCSPASLETVTRMAVC